MAVQQAMSIYNQRKTDYVNRLVGTMREATNLCNGYALHCVFLRQAFAVFPINCFEYSDILLKMYDIMVYHQLLTVNECCKTDACTFVLLFDEG